MEYYVQINSSSVQYRSYTGLTEATIFNLLNAEGYTSFSFIDKTTFDAAIAALQTK
jgi:hypothetical protein